MTGRGPFESLTSGRRREALEAPLRLFLDTAAAMRADPRWLSRPEDVVGGLMLDAESPAETEGLTAVLARIEALEPRPGLPERAARRAARGLEEILALPEPARGAALEALERRSWMPAGLGMRLLPLVKAEGSAADLIRIEPGNGPPTHDHRGPELTLVMCGAYTDHTGRYGPGDISIFAEGETHRPRAEPGGPCLALTVTAGPPQFQGALGAVQGLLRLN